MSADETRIPGNKVVAVLLAVIVGILAWAFYRYYTVQPDPARLHELQKQRQEQQREQREQPQPPAQGH